MKIKEIWNELENDNTLSTGLLLRRYSALVLPDVFIALRQPEKLKCIAFLIRSQDQINLVRYSNLRDIQLDLVPDERDVKKKYLLIVLTSQQHSDVFETLCEDLILGISNVNNEDIIIKEVLNRFEKWKSLFDKAAQDGLRPEEQRGLFGELYFLRKWLYVSTDLQRTIQSWVGPEREVRDFQIGDWAVEVKTTYGNNHQKIHISSERQLDSTNLNVLFLLHLSLESQQHNGENLNQIIDSINLQLNSDIAVQSQFKSKLLLSGYFSHHKDLYDGTGYQVRQELFYSVTDGFPRIQERDIPNGIGDVKYTIILSEYSNYIISESNVFEIIK